MSEQNTQQAAPEAPVTRTFQAEVPAGMSDNYLKMLMQIGQLALTSVTNGGMILMFPQGTKNAAGAVQPAIGHVIVPILNAADIHRLAGLADVIGRANDAVIRARNSGREGELVNTAVAAETAKHNAHQDAVAQAQGKAGGIIIAG